MSDKKVNSPSKRTKDKKEEEVTCWNCFTTKDSDVEPVPLTKIREEQRHKFKLYSFFASELSKPKTVSLKQKVSEHYTVGKRLDEKICQNPEIVQHLQDFTETDAPMYRLSTSKRADDPVPEKRMKVDKSTETDLKITKVKLCRSDSSSSSSSSTPDFRPRRKIYSQSNTSIQSISFDRDKSIKTPVTPGFSTSVVDNKKLISKNRKESDSSVLNESQEQIQPSDNRQVSTPRGADNKCFDSPQTRTDFSDENERTRNAAHLREVQSSKTPLQKQKQLMTIGRQIDKSSTSKEDSYSSMDVHSPTKIAESPSKKSWSVDSKEERIVSLKQRLRERFSLPPPNPDVNKSSDITSPTKEFPRVIRPTTLKEILNEHYSIDKEIDETIAKYADLKKSRPKSPGNNDALSMEIHSPRRRLSKERLETLPPKKERVDSDINTKVLTSPDHYDYNKGKLILNDDIDNFSSTITDKSKTSTPKRESEMSSTILRSTSNTVDKDIDEMISKCEKLSISEDSYNESKIKSSSTVSNSTKERTPTTEIDKMPIKIPRTRLKRQSLTQSIEDSSLEINTGSSSSVNLTGSNEKVKMLASKFESKESLTPENQTKASNIISRRYSTDSQKLKTQIIIKPFQSMDSKEGVMISNIEKADNASYNGSESGYAGSSGTVQDLQENEMINKELEADIARKTITTKEDTSESSLKDQNFKTSSSSLSRISEKKILKTTTPSKSLSMDINKAGMKSPLKTIRWSTYSGPPKALSFQDEVYMSDTLSSGNATLPRRSSSPLPHERDLDRDRFPINRSGLQARSESMASVYSGAGEGARGSVAVRGEVQFSLLYNYRLGALEVGVKRCRDLAPVDVKRNRSDPYVKVYLLPDKSKAGKRKTKVRKNTLNPAFEETLAFTQPLASLSTRTLWLSVWHADMFGRNDFLGEVTLPLADVVFDDPSPVWYKLHERTEQFDEQQGSRGDLIVGLKFEPDASGRKGSLHVLVKEAKHLLATKPNGLADVFCKSYLLPERGRLAKQKTGVARRTLSPRWEHTFSYRGLSLPELAGRALELSLWDRDRLASNDFMGAVRLSLGTGMYMGASVNWMDSMGKEVTLWQTMMQRPNFWVEGSLPLRPQLNN